MKYKFLPFFLTGYLKKAQFRAVGFRIEGVGFRFRG